ncbi:MAG TPA: GNAT family N-acetyltransferase [Terriglobales bacterium]|nr:GNAT family N-acetyltransferase [Terriglobales bacterium]
MHVLDQPIWNALQTRQARWAEGGALARRFPPAMTTLGALREPSIEAFDALAALQQPGEATALLFPEAVGPPPGWEVIRSFLLPQFIHVGDVPAPPKIEPEALGDSDSPAMYELARLTKPGPFGLRTYQLGGYYGVYRAGRLAAMAGERLQLPGYTEVSAVCTHPDFAGQGLAAGLVATVAGRIRARGETPFLHVVAENTRAIALYERLGFRRRREIPMLVVRRR